MKNNSCRDFLSNSQKELEFIAERLIVRLTTFYAD